MPAPTEKIVGPSGSAGYYATLDLKFDSTIAEVQKRYKKLALQLHPDKVGEDPVHIDRFQAATTAYQVLSSESAREAYWHMYRMRCYLFQVEHKPGQRLAPFYCFRVRKKDDKGVAQERLLTLDLREGVMQNWKKDKPHRKTELKNIKQVKQVGETTFMIYFKQGRDYRLITETATCCQTYVSVLQAISTQSSWIGDDDSFFPPPCVKKGYVEKQGKSGEWARRWLLLGSTSLLIFRSQECADLVNVVPIDYQTCKASNTPDSIEWTVTTRARRFVFRNSKPALAASWSEAVNTVLKHQPGQRSWLLPPLEGAARGSLLFSAEDIDEALSGTTRLLLDMALENAEETAGVATSGSDEETPPDGNDSTEQPRRNWGVFGSLFGRASLFDGGKLTQRGSMANGKAVADKSRSAKMRTVTPGITPDGASFPAPPLGEASAEAPVIDSEKAAVDNDSPSQSTETSPSPPEKGQLHARIVAGAEDLLPAAVTDTLVEAVGEGTSNATAAAAPEAEAASLPLAMTEANDVSTPLRATDEAAGCGEMHLAIDGVSHLQKDLVSLGSSETIHQMEADPEGGTSTASDERGGSSFQEGIESHVKPGRVSAVSITSTSSMTRQSAAYGSHTPMTEERLAAQRAALVHAEGELERAAKSMRIGKGRRGPMKDDKARAARAQAAEAELVGRAVANHLGQGLHGMVRHHL
ncbi:hypothetical protein AB1Y20_000951 [Prymnesium parvum]|uniref:J domain-containing protein n=1 Tax=Prymnesium parvum TaxID=97485 RepID=A0AB34KB79_PRYPA